MTRSELDKKLLFFQPEIILDRMIGNSAIGIEVDVFNNHINWFVQEGDHIMDFDCYEDAANYFFGEENEDS